MKTHKVLNSIYFARCFLINFHSCTHVYILEKFFKKLFFKKSYEELYITLTFSSHIIVFNVHVKFEIIIHKNIRSLLRATKDRDIYLFVYFVGLVN